MSESVIESMSVFSEGVRIICVSWYTYLRRDEFVPLPGLWYELRKYNIIHSLKLFYPIGRDLEEDCRLLDQLTESSKLSNAIIANVQARSLGRQLTSTGQP